MLAFLALFTAAQATASLTVATDHPAVKIIALLQKLQAQVKEEGEAETNAYGKFTYWCSEVIKENAGIVKKSKEEISVSQSSIEALTEDIATLTREIEQLEADITTDDSQKANAQKLRDSGNGLYGTNKADMEATVAAVGDAITALESSKPALVQTEAVQAVVQKAMAYVDIFAPQQGKTAAVAFLQSRSNAEPIESAEADEFENRKGRERTYDFKGGDIIETLKQLKLKFEDDLVELNKAETAAVSAHKLADAAKEDEINAATRAKDAKTEIKGQKGEDLASAEADLQSSTETLQTAQMELDETKQKCRTRADEFSERVQRRDGETAAMGQAIEVLEKITGVRTPESKGISFVQVAKKVNDPKQAIVNLLRKAGATKSTQVLAKLADKIAALKQTPGSGVFDQIKNMIQKMIFHLMSEQKDEDDHKNWCDKEIDQTTMMKEDKETKRDELQTAMDQLSAEIESLSTSITENTEFVANLNAEIEQATAQRGEEKAENEATIKDATDAQTAISQAIAVLEDFYKSTGEVAKEAWEAFVQLKVVRRVKAEPEPELWDGGESGQYTGTGGGSDVIGLLTDIAADFASMEAAARADETTQQEEYDTWLTGSKINKSEKEKDSQMKEARKGRLTEKLQAKTADHDHNQKELDATVQYEKDLQHACVDGDSTYADRKAARTQEITALKEAQTILENAFKEPAEESPP
jgi:uncharacterized small protein (DUF1192 family)